jgi:hypothetical protein
MTRTEGEKAVLPIQRQLGAEQIARADDGDKQRTAVGCNPLPTAKRKQPRGNDGNEDDGNARYCQKIGREVSERVVVALHCSVFVLREDVRSRLTLSGVSAVPRRRCSRKKRRRHGGYTAVGLSRGARRRFATGQSKASSRLPLAADGARGRSRAVWGSR